MDLKAFFLIAIFLVGCQTPYAKKGSFNGYEDIDLGQNRYTVIFKASYMTPLDRVIKFAVRRAKELCEENGREANISSAAPVQTGDIERGGFNIAQVNVECVAKGSL